MGLLCALKESGGGEDGAGAVGLGGSAWLGADVVAASVTAAVLDLAILSAAPLLGGRAGADLLLCAPMLARFGDAVLDVFALLAALRVVLGRVVGAGVGVS
jgi:hypothetical protein